MLLDVVYNHFIHDAERAEWMYDTNTHHKNFYYWYQGRETDWSNPDGGYLDNGSTGWLPNFRNEFVRKLFISSATMLLAEFHLDGFRVDLTQAFHRDNVIHANGAPCAEANLLGARFLREWVRTLRLIKPSVMLSAEDHTGWSAITQPQETGGVGFDAIWWADWYHHHLIGDSQNDAHNARLLHVAGFGGNDPLAMSYVAGALQATPGRVIYHESHDQAGNASYRIGDYEVHSGAPSRPRSTARSTAIAIGRRRAAASPAGSLCSRPASRCSSWARRSGRRSRIAMIDHREDLPALRVTSGAKLFGFYRDIIRLRRRYPALKSPHVEVLHVHDANRVLAFRRWLGDAEFLVPASLNNAPFADG